MAITLERSIDYISKGAAITGMFGVAATGLLLGGPIGIGVGLAAGAAGIGMTHIPA